MPKKLIAIILFLWSSITLTFAEVIVYPSPPASNLQSKNYVVNVRESGQKWLNTQVYWADVASVLDTKTIPKKSSFTSFDCTDKVDVKVEVKNLSVTNVRIRPACYNIVPTIENNVISFQITAGQYVSLEINDNIFENLQIFANKPDVDKIDMNDPNLIYFGPGIHSIGKMEVPSNKTIFLAGGSIVEGSFSLSHVKNVKICGRGILTQFTADLSQHKAEIERPNSGRNDELTIQYSNNIKVSGIIVMPHKYTALIGQCHAVNIDDLKSFSSEGNADGIDIFCSEAVSLNHLYMRNADDCIAVYGHRWQYYGNVKKISVRNSVLWADVAHPILIGTHGDSLHPDTLENIQFNNIIILDHHENQLDYQGCIALNAGDSNLIRNCLFEDFSIENIRKGQLINIRVMFNHQYNTSPGEGIQDITFSNIRYTGGQASTSIICGYDDHRMVKNILFKNLVINGKLITDDMAEKPGFYKTGDMANFFIGEHVTNLTFTSNK